MSPRPARRRVAVVAVAALLTGLGGALLAPPAGATSPAQQAAALAARVRALQAAAERAAEAYDAAEGRLGQVTAAQFAAERAATAAAAADRAAAGAGGATLRQLYEIGGPAALYTSVLTGDGSPLTVAGQLIAADRMLGADRTAAAAGRAGRAAADAAQRLAVTLAGEQSAAAAQAATQADRVRQALAQSQQLLAAADTRVAALAAADEAARAAADHAAFLQQLSWARAGQGAYAAAALTAAPASSPAAATALAAAQALSGHPYQWGGTGPVGYDCSGLTQAAYAAAGIGLPRTAAEQYLAGPHVPLADLQPGDLLFWATDPADPATIEHTAIYAGNGLMVSADHTGDVIRLQPVWWAGYAGATRPDPAPAGAVAAAPRAPGGAS